MRLTEMVAQEPEIKELIPQLAQAENGRHVVTGLSGSARTAYLAAYNKLEKPPYWS